MESNNPDKISSYLKAEVPLLIGTAITGIIYNVGLTAGPIFEGRLAETLLEVFNGKKVLRDMVLLALMYIGIIFVVQFNRFLKRLFVRQFANNVSRSMKLTLYGSLIQKTRADLEKEGAGVLITKAVSDVDTCAEGMRKFLTEVFDTGVALVSYFVMLLIYDFRLAVISLVFMPIPYIIAALLKKPVTLASVAAKESNGRLNQATLDRIDDALLYRITGQEATADSRYAGKLNDYEKKSVRSGILEGAPQYLYRSITYLGIIFVIYFGAKNVQGTGWKAWDIAAFTTFISCFAKLAIKSSKVAKLFNSVQKARASWTRIKPLMADARNISSENGSAIAPVPAKVKVCAKGLTFTYPGAEAPTIRDISFTASSGQITGVSGPVACGKSTLGKVFLMESDYAGSLTINGRELREFSRPEVASYVSYMGHDPELMSDTIRENVLLGDSGDVDKLLKDVDIYDEVMEMDRKEETPIGVGGVRLSGGQQQRIALARTLLHKAPVIVLDDPFSALDKTTEKHVLDSIVKNCPDSVIILITHRTYLLEKADTVLHLENGAMVGKEAEA